MDFGNKLGPSLLWALLTAVGAFVAASPARGEIVDFVESFSSWRHRDPTLTTAHWDTVAGALQLFPLGLDSLGVVPVPGSAYAAALRDTVLLVGADTPNALHSYGVGDPAHPHLLDSHTTLDGVRDVATAGSWAFLSVGGPGLQTVNIGDPADLVEGGSLDLAGFTYGLAVQGTRLYAAQSGDGVAVVDVSTPWQPALVASVPARNWARDVWIRDNELLVADSDSGLTVMDLSLPDSPQIIGRLATSGYCQGVTAVGDRVYLADAAGGLVIASLADPAAPLTLGRLVFPASANCRSVAARGDTVFCAVNDKGLYVVDVSDPSLPVVIGSRDTPGTAYQVTLDGTVIWLADLSGGLRAFELNPWALDESRNLAVSLNLLGEGEPVTRARLSATMTDSIRFELTADGGGSWHPAQPGGDWVQFPVPGEDFRWRAVLVPTGGPEGPICSQLELTYEKLHGYGSIGSVSDVPDDTGGQVRVVWSPSRFDSPGADYEVTGYSIYRRFDQDTASGVPLKSGDAGLPYPPGSWDYLTTVPADMESTYAAVVPTLRDSTLSGGAAWSVFFVRTRTATLGVFFDSPPDSGCSVNNLQPAPPTGFVIDRSPADGTRLFWDPPADPDFAHFRLYRSAFAAAPAQPATLFQVTTGTEVFDPEPGTWYYLLTVVDLAGQESEPAAGLSGAPAPSATLLLRQNTPNPFNPRTVLDFEVPAGGRRVSLRVFDAEGRRVRTLVEAFLPGGAHSFSWDGRDGRGHPLASGIYFARLEGTGTGSAVKMTLVR